MDALLFLLTICFSLVSHPLPSLINNFLNLPVEAQGRSWSVCVCAKSLLLLLLNHFSCVQLCATP